MFYIHLISGARTLYPQRWQIVGREIFLCYLDLCYVNPTYQKLETFPQLL